MRLAWATDVHLNFVDEPTLLEFFQGIKGSGVEAVLLGGDIAESSDLVRWLRILEQELARPIYFVLGNHDYYGSDVATVRQSVQELGSELLFWLPQVGLVSLTSHTALVGHGGWGDARIGEFSPREVLLNDYLMIGDLLDSAGGPNRSTFLKEEDGLKRKLQQLGDDAARVLRPALLGAVERFPEVIVLTHVPPFRESCWYEDTISSAKWLPAFTCKVMGDLLLEAADSHPDCRITVLCGHTHGEGEAHVRPNVFVRTGSARYGRPGYRLIEAS
jgi:predicted phosphodiesterase